MDHSKAFSLYQEVQQTQACAEQYKNLLSCAARYSRIRTEFLAPVEGKKMMGRTRSISHDAFIDSCNRLRRAMYNNGEPNEWCVQLGTDRKEMGDWACFIRLFLGLEAR